MEDRIIFQPSGLLKDSRVYNIECDLDFLPPIDIIDKIMIDFVMYRISIRGFPDLNIFPNKVGRTKYHSVTNEILNKLTDKADEFERQYYPRFENRKSLLEKIPERAFLDFIDTLHGIFEDNQINWGRIIGYFTFVGSYCTACIEHGMVRIVYNLVEYAIKYMNTNLSGWMSSNGGWRGLGMALSTESFELRF
uniref:Bcl2-2 n=1 Tax=Schmidtea mediterranea TaxID=79327 RepID=H2DL19_SCHMD|nr:bcl2-2 [Schmidtea mediterranea]